MKKFYFLAATAIVMASCTSEESVFEPKAPQEIAFQAVATNATRGAVTSATGWNAPINVASAYQANSGGDYSNLFSAAGDFVTYTNSGGVSGWTSATPYYYPSDGIVDFLAYATGTAGVDQVVPETTLTRGGSDQGISNLKLDYTAEGKKLTGSTDVMYAFKGGLTCPQTAPVALQFHHTLAWLSITMTAPANTVKITSLNANNVSLTGVLNIPVSDHAIGTPAWTPSAAEAAVPFKSFCKTIPTYVGDLTDEGGILVIPGNQTQLTLVYRLDQNPDVDITHVIDLSGVDNVWEAGKHYVYNISFNNMNEISFTCSVDDYEIVNSGVIKP